MNLHEIRSNLARCLAALDQHLAGQASNGSEDDPPKWRVRPGGPLSEEGIEEIETRFETGESDSAIALSLQISLDGVARRRSMWRKQKRHEAELAEVKEWVDERKNSPPFKSHEVLKADALNKAIGIGSTATEKV